MSDSSLFHPVSIGNVSIPGNVFLAPVAGYSDAAFRSICRSCGAAFTYTEMVSAEALFRGSGKTESLMRRAEGEDQFAVQLFGGSAESMSAAVAITLDRAHPEVIDINAGCPVPKIVKGGAGSALTHNPEKLFEVVSAAVKVAGSVPVTVKIRSGWDADHLSWKEAALAALDAGVAAITMHPRTRAQGYEGKSDWSLLAALVKLVDGRVPVFGSGDLFSADDARRMLTETGCDGVMFARGAMGNPFIFTEARDLLTKGSFSPVPAEVRLKTGMHELELLIADVGEVAACREMRKRFCCYTKGITGAAALRPKVVQCSTLAEYRQIYNELIVKSTISN